MLITDLFGTVTKIESNEYEESKFYNGNLTKVDIHMAGVNIINLNYTPKFLNEANYQVIYKLTEQKIDYDCILAYAYYDNVDTFGFRFIDIDNSKDRLKYQHNNGILYESGDPVDEELKYLNGRYYRDEQEDDLVVMEVNDNGNIAYYNYYYCLLYTSDAADE